MNNFDFNIMDAAGYGYYRVWKERNYLLKLAIIPVLIKLASMIAISVMDEDVSLIRQGLIMLPADFAKGWLMAQFLRTLLLEERWPVTLNEMPDEKTLSKLLLRARGIVSSTIAFVLIAMFGNVVMYLLIDNLSPETASNINDNLANIDTKINNSAENSNPLFYVLSALGLVGAMWLFRMFWIYIPFVVLMPVTQYLKALGGFMASVKMFVLYLSCLAPIMLVMIVLSRISHVFFTAVLGEDNAMSMFATILLSVIADFLITLIATASMVWAMRGFLPKSANALNDFPKNES